MQFLADESCDYGVVRALREAGQDVQAIADLARAAEDVEVIRRALQEKRILLTEDKDFGRLVHAHRQKAHAVVFIRYPAVARKQLVRDVVRLAHQHGRKLAGWFVVVEPGRVRFTRL